MTPTLEQIYARQDVTALQKTIYTILAAHADENGLVQFGQTALAMKAGTDQRGVLRCLNTLRARGLISVARIGVKRSPAVLQLHAA